MFTAGFQLTHLSWENYHIIDSQLNVIVFHRYGINVNLVIPFRSFLFTCTCSEGILNYSSFPCFFFFYFDHTWRRLLQKVVVRLYVCIITAMYKKSFFSEKKSNFKLVKLQLSILIYKENILNVVG